MTVDELIRRLSALPERERALPVVIVPPDYTIPAEATTLTFIPLGDPDGIVEVGPCIALRAIDPAKLRRTGEVL